MMLRDLDRFFTADSEEPSRPSTEPLAWIETRSGHPYFFDEAGRSWTPVGHNDAITWPELARLFRRRSLGEVEAHFRALRSAGVTCVRLMLEYCQGEHRYIEQPAGHFKPNMVQLWDDLFAICERTGIRILLTPFDTFFTWIRWREHPYNQRNGGPCTARDQLLTCKATRQAIKDRIEFATRRWGGSGALFGWDLWNELHPAHARRDIDALADFVSDVAVWLKALEIEVHGRRHPLSVSVFGPELKASPDLNAIIFRHPDLDFANIHLYEKGSIDHPRNSVAPALAVGRLMKEALDQIGDNRPLFDTEHGPIHAFLDKKIILPEAFDEEYFRHIQWAHLASGGAGGGMRWPNRHPHVLTPGMRRAQTALAAFLPLIDWARFQRECLNDRITFSAKGIAGFGCGDERQLLLWLLRTDACGRDGTINADAKPRDVTAVCPAADGRYRARFFDTKVGRVSGETDLDCRLNRLAIPVRALSSDVAIAISRLD